MYGIAAIALGVLGLISRDFAAVWQPIENLIGAADRKLIAVLYAAALLVAGGATLWRKSAQTGLAMLTGLHFLATLGWVPRIVGYWRIYGTWNGFFELFSLVVAGAIAYAVLAPPSSAWRKQTLQTGHYLYAACLLSFAVGHFTALTQTAGMVPKWLPPGQMFWAVATGVFYLLAAAALAVRFKAALAVRLVTVMMLGFAVLAWGPLLLRQPEHFTWAGTAITVALASAAWIVADSLSQRSSESTARAVDSNALQVGSDLANPPV
ncbi:hypothetical protein [Steroidobacter cummioxidans]|uniref:hypothetical protein n=1 Tax=Steroidobacter cummioxidans TaxID=1803913 RepID=UPI000E315C62|nr:hypothetical protein [Steroidobacter cummioxidans]